MWQSLSFQSNYKAAYCLSVCPAGEDVVGPFLKDKQAFKNEIMKPLIAKEEAVYVVPGSDAEGHVAKRFPHKNVKRIGNGLRPRTIEVFLASLPYVFQREQSTGLDATYHFSFGGSERVEATVVIRNKKIAVQSNHVGRADMHVTADTQTWLAFLAKEKSLVWALLTRRIRLKGSPKLLVAFGKCFPS